MSAAVIPAHWTRLVSLHHYARIDREQMRTGATQQARDEATVRYSRAVDQIMDHLNVLKDRGELGRITLLLSREARA